MVVRSGNEGSDGPKLTSPLSRVALSREPPAPKRSGRRGHRDAGPAPRGRGLEGLGVAARLRPPSRQPRRCDPGRRALRRLHGLVRRADGQPPQSVVRGRPDLPTGLPPSGAHDRLLHHRRGGAPAVAHRRARSGRRGTPRGSLHGRSRVRMATRRRGRAHPRSRRRAGDGPLGADGQQRPLLRLPHRPRLQRPAGRRGGPGPAQPTRLAGRARPAAGARA